ncbi:fungal specific transcription factor domain-containing protein [Colletotrichum incanum]|uniref:Fungal specific transcription factor domain-containing protein n=1 Tax=Colletotrichum incanum TaxID=1573173 RepID=A0A162N7P6_COLIC|nr:fungal specific transcription factor domain-containing protein [Colletotrichum incanum]
MTVIKGEDQSASDDVAGTATQASTASCTQPPHHRNKQQVRHRASVACASCRDRRIRCVVPKGESECVQCKKAGSECIIKNDDERRRPISKAYMSSLSNRIAMLENMLLEKGVQPPPALHPPKSRHEALKPSEMPLEQQEISAKQSIAPKVPSPLDSGSEDCTSREGDCAGAASVTSPDFGPLSKEQSPFHLLEPGVEDVVHHVLSTRGNLSFDQLSGRLRFFGLTVNSHVCHTEPKDDPICREPPEQIRRAERIIQSLTNATHNYLIDNFWTHYNSVLNVVSKEAFESNRESQNPKFYSPFLHISILAMGFRFADPSREDMKRIALGNRESSLHREAKHMLGVVLERSGGIPSVQALLLLGDLEYGVGRDNTGWMYAGMANRLAFDIGLHLDCRNNDISEQEVNIRHMVMRACVVYDKYWALFLGRPTSIRNQDIDIDLIYRGCPQLTSLMGRFGRADKANNTAEVYDHLVELMGIAGCIVETEDKFQARDVLRIGGGGKCNGNDEREKNAYLYAIDLDRQLQNWYRRLPEHLKWKPANIKHAPFSYFLLHQQYHVSMILLHRPWARYEEIGHDNTSTSSYSTSDSSSNSRVPSTQHRNYFPETRNPHMILEPSRAVSSRRTCSFHASRVAKIFGQHRQEFDGTKIFITAVQHAGTAAIALIAAAAHHRNDSDKRTYLDYLEILASAIGDMKQAYEPAARMESLLKTVLVQLRSDIGNPSDIYRPAVTLTGNGKSSLSNLDWKHSMDSMYLVLPARRAADTINNQPCKRRRPSATSRRAPESGRRSLPFFTNQSQKPLRRASQSQPSVGDRPSFDPIAFTASSSDHRHYNLAFLNGPDYELEEPPESKTEPTEDSILVTPPSDSWPIGIFGESAMSVSQKGDFGYDELMSEHGSGTPSVGLNSPLDSNDSGRRDEGAGLKNSTVSRGIIGDQMSQSDTKSKAKELSTSSLFKVFCHGGMDWVGSEDALSTIGSVSLGELVQNSVAGKVVRDRTHEAPRNHELDFLSF